MRLRQIDVDLIRQLSVNYRKAIEDAVATGRLNQYQPFHKFPTGCCGKACYLLAEYLRANGVNTICCFSNRNDWTHAWLVLKEDWMQPLSAKESLELYECKSIISAYWTVSCEEQLFHEEYDNDTTAKGILIDITGDQFDDCFNSVYVGKMDHFHELFEFRSATAYIKLNDEELREMYSIISEYLNK